MKKNSDVRREIKEAGLCHWEVGERLGLNDGNFSRLLRRELAEDNKEIIRQIISQLKKERHDNIQSR